MNTSKIIKGVVSNGRYTVTAPIVKEDYGLYLKIEGVELPSTYQVDFSNDEHNGGSVTMIGNSDGVRIPKQFIKSGKDVFAFLYHVGTDFGRTVYKFRIPNKVRPDRTNEEPTPEEQSVIDQAISALNEAVAQTAQDVESADQSAQSAQGYAEQAETARDTAQTYANNAQTSATSANQSATASANSASASAQSASQSAQIKADVEDLVDDAQSYAESALIASQASVTARDTAQGYAQSASASASSASGYASSAQGSANIASAKAQDASGYAQTASGKASEASQSATTASNKASEASGYATSAQTAQGKAEEAQTAAETAQGLAESARDSAIQAKNDAESAVASISGALNDKADIITDTASGAIASFPDGADDLPLKSLIVDINPIQDLSQGDPSPENICPISGWTEVDVEQSGENVGRIYAYSAAGLPTPQSTPVVSNSYGTTISTTDPQANKIVVTQTRHDGSTDTSYLNGFFVVGVDNIINGQRYYFRAKVNVTANPLNTARLHGLWNGRGNTIPLTIANGYATGTFVASISDERRYLEIRCAGASFEMSEIMFMLAEDMSSPYSHYTGRSITINLGQTVYGGKLDVLSGMLRVDRAMVTFDGTENYQNAYFPTVVCTKNIGDSGDYSRRAEIFSNYCSAPNVGFGMSTATTIQWKYVDQNFGVSSADELKALFAQYNADGNPMTVVYPLAEPIEIQLSANQINSLYGVNNIWADSGNTEVEYRADTKLYIQKKIAEAISALS